MTNYENGKWMLSGVELGLLMYVVEDAYRLGKKFTPEYDRGGTLRRLLEEYGEKRSKMGE